MFNPSSELFDLSIAAGQLVDRVIDISKSQKDLWNRVPWLALQADGRTGYNDQLSFAYEHGLWRVEESIPESGSRYTIFVDLKDGLLCRAGSGRQPARRADILATVIGAHSAFDAQRIVSELAEMGRAPYAPMYDQGKVEKWREERIRQLGLKEIYP